MNPFTKLRNWIMGKKPKSIEPLRVSLTVSGTGSLRTFTAKRTPANRKLQWVKFFFGDGYFDPSGHLVVAHHYEENGVYQARVEIADYHGVPVTSQPVTVNITSYAPPLPVPGPRPIPVPAPIPQPPPPAPVPEPPPPAPTPVPEPAPIPAPHPEPPAPVPAPVPEPPPPAPIPEPEPPPAPIPPPVPQTPDPESVPVPVPTPIPEPVPAPPLPAPIPHPTPPPPPPSGADVVITLDPSKTFQTMQGFGCTQRTMGDGHLVNPASGAPEFAIQISEADKQKVYDVAYRDLGLTRLRLATQGAWRQPNQSGPPRFDGVFGDAHIELAAALESRGVSTVWDSVMNYDVWEYTPQKVADWNMNWIRYWRAKGRPDFSYFSIANEPYNQATMTPEFMRDSIKILGRMLRDEGYLTKLVCPDDINPAEAAKRTRAIMADPEARQYIGALCCHLYEVPLTQMSEMRALADQYGLPLWMTEYSAYSVAPEQRGMFWANIMHECLVTYSCSAVDFMSGFFGTWDKAHLVTLNVGADGKTFAGYTLTDEYYVMGQWSKYVRPGAVRIEASSSHPDVKVSAFAKDGKKTVVAVNSGDATLIVQGVAGSWETSVTWPMAAAVWSEGASSGMKPIPPQSVMTFVEV